MDYGVDYRDGQTAIRADHGEDGLEEEGVSDAWNGQAVGAPRRGAGRVA